MEEQTAKEYVGNEQRFSVRTDLALEARELVGDERSEISGVRYSVRREGDYEVTISVVEVLNEEGEKAMGKPKGRYVTLECPELKENILEAHQEVMEILTRELRRMIPLKDDTKTLVIGLGNRQVTADALGPLAVSGLLVTRHLYAVAPHELKDRIRPVSAIAPGVMGQTGVETGELVAGLTDKVKPDVVIAIDALASRRTSRVNTTIQIADTGINPGAGVGNFRQELSSKTLGVPVISIGVPTVVDAATIVSDTIEYLQDTMKAQGGIQMHIFQNFSEQEKYQLIQEVLKPNIGDLYVTPKDMDAVAQRLGNVIAGALNMVLHHLEPEELKEYLY